MRELEEEKRRVLVDKENGNMNTQGEGRREGVSE